MKLNSGANYILDAHYKYFVINVLFIEFSENIWQLYICHNPFLVNRWIEKPFRSIRISSGPAHHYFSFFSWSFPLRSHFPGPLGRTALTARSSSFSSTNNHTLREDVTHGRGAHLVPSRFQQFQWPFTLAFYTKLVVIPLDLVGAPHFILFG